MEIAQPYQVPALDIIVPTHNNLDLTKKCVQSIYLYTQTPFHLIIVDDSTDELTPLYFKLLQEKGIDILKKAENITFLHQDIPFKTGNEFFNLGFRYCKTPYVATVMNSMTVEPEWEITALDIMQKSPEVGLIGFKCLFAGDHSNVGHIESAGIRMVKYLPTDIGRDLAGHALTKVYEVDASQWAFALLRKKAVIGVLDPYLFNGFKGWDDIDNCFVLKSKGWKILYCGFGVGYHQPRATRGSNSAQAAIENKENGTRFYKRWGFWDEFHKDHPNDEDIHLMPKENQQAQDMLENFKYQPVRD